MPRHTGRHSDRVTTKSNEFNPIQLSDNTDRNEKTVLPDQESIIRMDRPKDMSMNYSVALCTFNGEKYIADQLASILNQTLPPMEIVVSDDGSKDRTLEIVKQILSSSHVRYSILHNTDNHGVTGNFFSAISACHEAIIFTSDQDDVWVREKAEKMLPFFSDPGTLLVFSDGELVSESLEPLGTAIFQVNGVSERFLKEKDWMTYLYSNWMVTGATMALRASLMDGVREFPKEWLHDAFLAAKAASLNGLAACEEKLILYRQHESNTVGMHEVGKREKVRDWVRRNRRLPVDRNRRYQRFQSLYEEIQSCLTAEENARMSRFLVFLKELSDVSEQSGFIQIPVILKHYLNGDYSLFYNGGKTTFRAVLAVLLYRIAVQEQSLLMKHRSNC